MAELSDIVPARRRAGFPPVVIAPSESVVQPLVACACHTAVQAGAVWHPGEIALVRLAELVGEVRAGVTHEGRADIEPLDPSEDAAYQSAVARGVAPHEAVRAIGAAPANVVPLPPAVPAEPEPDAPADAESAA